MKNMCGTTSDIISDLPDTIIEKILVLMSIRDAVRTSVLSKKLRFNWINIPVLAFDDTSLVDPCPTFFHQLLPPDQLLSIKNRLLATIYHVLLLHRGPILKFSLSISELKSCSEIDVSISILSNHGIQELTLQIRKGDPHELPQSLFSCQQLTYLNLHSCVFKRPTTFKGFPRVVCLELREVIITADLFETFVSSCPVLEQLTFESSSRFDFNGIDAPNLKVLSLMGIFKSISVKNAPKVANFSIRSKASVGVVEGGGKFDWAGLLDGLPVLKSLRMDSPYLMSLVEEVRLGQVGQRLPTLWHLNILELSDVHLGKRVVGMILKLITHSPTLHKVIIKPIITGDKNEASVLKFCEATLVSSKWYLNYLREVEMRLVSGAKIELHFMKFLLAKSRVLESMVVKPNPAKVSDGGLSILKELSQFQRLSPKAKSCTEIQMNERQV
ncbi:F-box/FBD/LRR-repeat protein At1g13570-like [Rhododendron vialii]|uniref:F-box/FBD/LRR-repeat protein At1g13570-like n=1 Tax=Rhododendron vialii TaxID=182163 RepID=UPI00265D7B89|nr:F-box/FBD/LRR-repeat protein At1g13570-like [Rhododendron vialii]